jgi:predicted dienelactone hydrolase
MPGAAAHWRTRAEDMKRILDRLDALEAAVPQLAGRLDRSRVAVAGHSMGGHTASLLLGARLTDPHDGTEVDLAEPRIKAGVLLAAPGRGGDALTEFTVKNYSFFLTTDFSTMTTPTLVVAGDKDDSAFLTVRGPAWHADPYTLSPGPKSLLTLFDAEHGLGGVSGYDVAETTDENPERVAAVARLTCAYLRSELYPGDSAWQAARDALTAGSDPLGRVESK